MKTLFLNLGYKCNCDCIYCVTGGIQEEFDTDDFVSLDELKKIDINSCSGITLTGGEPTINPEFFNILDYIREKEISIQTNGILFGSDSFFNKILKYNISGIFIPINSYKPSVHNFIMKNNSTFENAIKGVKNCIDNNIKVIVKVVLTKLNYKDLFGTVEFLSKLGVKDFQIVYPTLNGNFNKYLLLSAKYEKIRPYIDSLVDLEKKYNIKMYFESFPYCMVSEKLHKNIFEIAQYKSEYIQNLNIEVIKKLNSISKTCVKDGYKTKNIKCEDCEIIKFKNNFNNISPLHENLKNEVNARCLDNGFKQKTNKCVNCKYNLICAGVFKKYIKKYGDSDLTPISKKLEINNLLKWIKYQNE